MFAGAAFSDQADIQSTEAVDALTALGVIEGYTDGSFRPDVTVTRAEMAKMIFTILNGGNDDASAYANLPTSFTDLTDNWYKGYIKYLQNSGIIAGKSATRFAPNETVTGVEAAKMLLVVAGYNADKAGLEGLSWMANTMKYANLNNLFEDVDTDINAGLPRQYAAQIMFNALDMERVVYSNDISDFKPADAADVNDDSTIGYKYLSLVTYGDDADEELYLTSVKKEDGRETYSLNGGDFTRVSKDCSDLIGQRIAVMMKEGKSNQVYGVFAYEDSKVVATGYVGQLETVSNDEKIKLDGTEYKLNNKNDVDIVYNFNDDTKTNLDKLADDVKATRNNLAAAEITLIDNNGDGKVDTATYMPVTIGKVNAVTSTSVTINNGIGTFKFADDTIYDGIAKNDYVRVIDEDNAVEGGNHVEKLDVTSGKVTGTRTGEAKVDNTWYKLAGGAYDVKVSTNTTYDLVIVGNTIFYADETDGSVKNVAYIGAVADEGDKLVGDNNYTQKVRMYLPDGTDLGEVKVSKIAGDKLTSNTALSKGYENMLVTYTKLSDDTYDVKLVSGTNLAGCDAYVPSDKVKDDYTNGTYNDGKIGGVSLADDAVIYVETGKETKVLTGAQVKDWGKTVDEKLVFASSLLTKETNGIDYVQVATLVTAGDANVPGSKDTLYAYAVTDEYDATVDGEDKAAVDVWNGSETVTLYADAGDMMSKGTVKAGALISYKVNGNFVEQVAVVGTEAAVVGFDGKAEGEVKVTNDSGTYTYTLSEDVVVLTVDDANNNGVDGASIDSIVEAGYTADGKTRVNNVMYVLGAKGTDDEGKIVAIVIDSENNELA